jgi:hypothetical protein
MAKGRRRRPGTDVTRLWDMPEPGPTIGGAATGATDVDRRITELRDLLGQIRSEKTEAHGILRDLRIETRSARRIIPMLVSRRINKVVEEQLEGFAEVTKQAMVENVAKVTAEFEKLQEVLLGQDHQSRREGRTSVPDLVEDMATINAADEVIARYKGAPDAQSTSSTDGTGKDPRPS